MYQLDLQRKVATEISFRDKYEKTFSGPAWLQDGSWHKIRDSSSIYLPAQRIKEKHLPTVKMKSHYITLLAWWRRFREYLEPVMRAIVRNADELPPAEQEEEEAIHNTHSLFGSRERQFISAE